MSLQEWRELEGEVNGRRRFGAAGVRDPDHPCELFAPVPDIDWLGLRVAANGNGMCDSDGHYLCGGCAELSRSAWEERTGETHTSRRTWEVVGL